MATDLEAGDEKPVVSVDDRDDRSSMIPNVTAAKETTKIIVDWEGPHDPENPQNWPAWKRLTQVIFASAFLLTA